jgi:hypothetical protein
MKKIPLLPRYFRWIGLVLLVVGLVLHYRSLYVPGGAQMFIKTFVIYSDKWQDGETWFNFTTVDYELTLQLIVYLISLTFIAFSRNKVEDEMINSIRLYSWSWAIIFVIIFAFISTLCVYGLAYLSFACMYIEVLLLFYIIIFWVNIWQMNRRLANEE